MSALDASSLSVLDRQRPARVNLGRRVETALRKARGGGRPIPLSLSFRLEGHLDPLSVVSAPERPGSASSNRTASVPPWPAWDPHWS
jgi:hypothetical protein